MVWICLGTPKFEGQCVEAINMRLGGAPSTSKTPILAIKKPKVWPHSSIGLLATGCIISCTAVLEVCSPIGWRLKIWRQFQRFSEGAGKLMVHDLAYRIPVGFRFQGTLSDQCQYKRKSKHSKKRDFQPASWLESFTIKLWPSWRIWTSLVRGAIFGWAGPNSMRLRSFWENLRFETSSHLCPWGIINAHFAIAKGSDHEILKLQQSCPRELQVSQDSAKGAGSHLWKFHETYPRATPLT